MSVLLNAAFGIALAALAVWIGGEMLYQVLRHLLGLDRKR